MKNASHVAKYFARQKDCIVAQGNKKRGYGDPENRKANSSRPSPIRRQQAYAFGGGRPSGDDGRSGYGSESVRPYLRAQLKLKELLAAAGNLEAWIKRGNKRYFGDR